ncbi:hypothetical protein DFJ63DRAFT_315145 [Scheffersomyces coipomensis]|uniref:uncharacterized protein n=1 Tax=Scheffersomyces coipomensis TaxID=1788519 RepID=UPI00315C5FBF
MTPKQTYDSSSGISDYQKGQITITSLLLSPGPKEDIKIHNEKVSSRRKQDSISKPVTGSFGTTFKLLKACSFCRRRKIKCVVHPNSNICENCKTHNEDCIFDHKVVNNNLESKRKVRTKTKSSKEVNSSIQNPFPITLTGSTPNSIDISPSSTLSSYNTSDHIEILYQTNVEEFTPFLNSNVFKVYLDKFCENCIQLAVSQNDPTLFDSHLDIINTIIRSDSFEWNETNLACFFLVAIREPISYSIIEESLVAFNSLVEEKFENLSVNLILGAMVIDGFYSMFNGSKLTTNRKLLSKVSYYLNLSDSNIFSHHFLFVGYFIYNMVWLVNDDTKLSYVERKQQLLQLEFDILLWPAKLTPELSIVKDKLGGNYSAFNLHILHNCLLCCFYTYALKSKDTISKMIHISPVPGLYHFISGLAQSNFRVIKEINSPWTLLSNCIVKTAKSLVDLYEIMDFDPFKNSLYLFTKLPNVYDNSWQDEVQKGVENILMGQSYKLDDDIDGAVVFWVFRDIRSLALQSQIDEKMQ